MNCSFCSATPETVTHLFWHCPFVKRLWTDVCNFIANHIEADFKLFWKDVLFGIFDSNRNSTRPKETFIINLILILAKFHIHKCKFTHKKPSFVAFYNELLLYSDSIKFSHNQKAIKTTNICVLYNLFM